MSQGKVKKKGNYVLVDTNHALTLDWFRSPRGPQGAHFMGFQPTRATDGAARAEAKLALIMPRRRNVGEAKSYIRILFYSYVEFLEVT